MPSTTTTRNTVSESAHGNLTYLGRRAQRTTETATAVAAAGVHTGAWVSAIAFRKVPAAASGGGGLNVTLSLDLDYDGDSVADETITVGPGATAVVTERAFTAEQVRIRITNNGASAQNLTGHLMLGD